MSGMDEHRIPILHSWDKDAAVLETRSLAARAGFGNGEQVLLATVTSELATNILRFAGKGELVIRLVQQEGAQGLEIEATDQGPGIADVELAMQDHYSTFPGSLGLGLSSVKRIMDEFQIETAPQRGTRILARKWKPHGPC